MHIGHIEVDCPICERLARPGYEKVRRNLQAKPAKTTQGKRFLPLSCIHRGELTGETRPCKTCGGRQVTEPLLACAVHGVCTEARLVAGVACCRICEERAVRS